TRLAPPWRRTPPRWHRTWPPGATSWSVALYPGQFGQFHLAILVEVVAVPHPDQCLARLAGFFLRDHAVLVEIVVGEDGFGPCAGHVTAAFPGDLVQRRAYLHGSHGTLDFRDVHPPVVVHVVHVVPHHEKIAVDPRGLLARHDAVAVEV